jgi:hypothetical protein
MIMQLIFVIFAKKKIYLWQMMVVFAAKYVDLMFVKNVEKHNLNLISHNHSLLPQ